MFTTGAAMLRGVIRGWYASSGLAAEVARGLEWVQWFSLHRRVVFHRMYPTGTGFHRR